ncbi:MAG: DNA-binding transcriptional regulator [Eubacteriaceae bacterium]|nr:DNA-binding transcriptional regulator [Eubacteriaceae bacterium]MBR0383475.1 DNA-binding transcriptional regulator [Eubacteriaceae bacterium]
MKAKKTALAKAILSLNNEKECLDFLEDMCTIKEIEDMASRLEIAKLLSEGKTFVDVERETGASSATISRVNRCLKHGGGYRMVLERIDDE